MLLFLFTLTLSSSQSIPVTEKNLDEIMYNTGKNPVFVKFFSPYCMHCQHFAPIWTEFSQKYKGNCIIAEVNCEEQRKICAKFEIDTYPTLKWIDKSRQIEIDYDDFERTVDSLIVFVHSKSSYPFERVNSINDVISNQKHTNFFVFEFSELAHDSYINVSLVAQKYAKFNIPVYSILSKTTQLSFYDISSKNLLKSTDFNLRSVYQFFEKNSFGYFNEIKPEHLTRFSELNKPIIIYFIDTKDNTKKELRGNLVELKSKYHFFFSNALNEDDPLINLFNHSGFSGNFLVYIKPETLKYQVAQAYSQKTDLETWIHSLPQNSEINWPQVRSITKFEFPTIPEEGKGGSLNLNKRSSDRSYLYMGLMVLCIFVCILFLHNHRKKTCQYERTPGRPCIQV